MIIPVIMFQKNHLTNNDPNLIEFKLKYENSAHLRLRTVKLYIQKYCNRPIKPQITLDN